MTTLIHFFDINTIFFSIWWYDMSYIEFFGTIFNILCVRLASRNKISNWPIGILGIIFYIFLFYQIQLYADLIEQFYFLITSFYGWWAWSSWNKQKKGTAEEGVLIIQNTTLKENIIYGGITIICTVAFAYLIQYLPVRFPTLFPEPASYPWLDSFTTVLSFVATILMARRKISCRYLRILVDIIGIGLYFVKGVKFISLEYVIFLVLATLWLVKWLHLYKAQQKADKSTDTD